MTNYVKVTNFTAKDSLVTGDPGKLVKGYDFDVEFDNLATAVATKADLASPSLTGTPTAPTATAGTETTQIATTAFVATKVANAISTEIAADIAAAVAGIQWGNWTIVESGGVLYFKYSGTSKAKLDSSGNLTVAGNVTAYGSV